MFVALAMLDSAIQWKRFQGIGGENNSQWNEIKNVQNNFKNNC